MFTEVGTREPPSVFRDGNKVSPLPCRSWQLLSAEPGRFFHKFDFATVLPVLKTTEVCMQLPGNDRILTENHPILCFMQRWYLDSIRLHVELFSRSQKFFLF
jgi:hypothetical protein